MYGVYTLQQKGGGSSKEQGRSTDGLLGLELEGRKEGVRYTQAAGKRWSSAAELHTHESED